MQLSYTNWDIYIWLETYQNYEVKSYRTNSASTAMLGELCIKCKKQNPDWRKKFRRTLLHLHCLHNYISIQAFNIFTPNIISISEGQFFVHFLAFLVSGCIWIVRMVHWGVLPINIFIPMTHGKVRSHIILVITKNYSLVLEYVHDIIKTFHVKCVFP